MRAETQDLTARFGGSCVTTLGPASSLLSRCLDPETPVVQPDSQDMLQEALRYACAAGLRVWPAGGMEHSTHEGLPDAVDLVLSLRRMARLVDYEPGDLTMVVEAGVPLQVIAARAGEAGQRLAAEPWPGTAASIGGALAMNRGGPSRLRAGTLRDALLGCRVVHADGTTTRSGGRVVKNVTGFDLPKLYVGSMGTLVLLTELNLRLSPCPETSALVLARVHRSRVHETLLPIHRQGTGPVALAIFQGQGIPGLPERENTVHLVARFEGREPVVRQQALACAEAWKGEELPQATAQSVWTALRQQEEPEAGRLVLRVSSLPTAGMQILDAVHHQVGAGSSALALFAVGTCSVRLPRGCAVEEAVALQDRLEAAGSSVRWLHTEGAGRGRLRGTRPASAALHEATKALFDAAKILPDASWREERRRR